MNTLNAIPQPSIPPTPIAQKIPIFSQSKTATKQANLKGHLGKNTPKKVSFFPGNTTPTTNSSGPNQGQNNTGSNSFNQYLGLGTWSGGGSNNSGNPQANPPLWSSGGSNNGGNPQGNTPFGSSNSNNPGRSKLGGNNPHGNSGNTGGGGPSGNPHGGVGPGGNNNPSSTPHFHQQGATFKVKPDPKDYKTFSNESKRTPWFHDFTSTIHAQGLSEVFNPLYVPQLLGEQLD